jgi:hypothetical protein
MRLSFASTDDLGCRLHRDAKIEKDVYSSSLELDFNGNSNFYLQYFQQCKIELLRMQYSILSSVALLIFEKEVLLVK